MHPYISHLLADISAAHRKEEYETPVSYQSLQEELQQVEEWCAAPEKMELFGHYCGLKAEQFPPAGQLSTADMTVVCKAFRQMMCSWNIDIRFPQRLPVESAYDLLIGMLEEQTFIPARGFVCFDSCTGFPSDCSFGEYCACREFGKDELQTGGSLSKY